MFPRVTLILGGAASGKSDYAEALARQAGKPMTYLATSRVFDAEMQAKIDRHKAARGDDWTTIEAPMHLAPVLASLTGDQVCLLDCATLWLSNHMLAGTDPDTAQAALLDAIGDCAAGLIVVSNEVGHGIVPENALARRFREAQGRLNIALAARADLAVLVTAGLPLVLKGALP